MRRHRRSDRRRVLILGAGGHGRVVLDILLQEGCYDVLGFLDNNPDIHGRRVDGLPVCGGIDDLEGRPDGA
jgi:FlaA1/EpsC-like NDP-sugar epimerase